MRAPLLILTFSTFFLTTCDSLHEGDRVLCAENTADFVTDFSVLINGKPWIGSNDRTIYARPYGTDSMSLSLGVGGTSGTAHQIEHIFLIPYLVRLGFTIYMLPMDRVNYSSALSYIL